MVLGIELPSGGVKSPPGTLRGMDRPPAGAKDSGCNPCLPVLYMTTTHAQE